MGCVESRGQCHICFEAGDVATSYKGFDFFLCEECSTDVVAEVARDWAKKHHIILSDGEEIPFLKILKEIVDSETGRHSYARSVRRVLNEARKKMQKRVANEDWPSTKDLVTMELIDIEN